MDPPSRRNPDPLGTTSSDSPSVTIPTPGVGRVILAPPSSAAPSEPRVPYRSSYGHIDLSPDRPARLQLLVALFLGLVLVAMPLYLWRRPRAESIPTTGTPASGIVAAEPGPPTGAPPPATVIVGKPRTLLCQTPGKKTPTEACDHLVELENAFALAITENAGCVPRDAGGGSVTYVAEVNFKRRSLTISTPREGRTLKRPKAVSSCQTAIKTRLQTLGLDAMAHAHVRYKIAIVATYPGGS